VMISREASIVIANDVKENRRVFRGWKRRTTKSVFAASQGLVHNESR